MMQLWKRWAICSGGALVALGAAACGDSGSGQAPVGQAGTAAVIPQAGTGASGTPGAAGTGVIASPGAAGTPGVAGTGVAGRGVGGGVAGAVGFAGAAATAGAGGMAATAGAGGATGAAAGAGGTLAAAGTGGASGTPGMSDGAQMLPPVTDYSAAGPFETTMKGNTGPGSGYTIFRPATLGKDGFLHSPIIFGPGVATSGATSYVTFLTHLASHGFVVISVNTFGFSGPGDPAHIAAMREGLDWLIEQNGQAGDYQGKLAVKRAVAMGYSLGATAAALLADHEAIMTTVAIHGHMQMTRAQPHGPMLLLTGTEDVIAQVRATVAAVSSAPIIMGAIDGQDHLSVIPSQLGKGAPEFTAATAWLRYWVNGDQNAKNYFSGDPCTMCSDPWIPAESNAAWEALML